MAANDGIGEVEDGGEIGAIGDIERVLRAEEIMAPSPGFALRVMDFVRQEAAVPPPIEFPWQGLLAGIAAIAAIAACCAWVAAGSAALLSSGVELRLPALRWDDPALTAVASGLGWTLAALAGTYLLTWFARELVRT